MINLHISKSWTLILDIECRPPRDWRIVGFDDPQSCQSYYGLQKLNPLALCLAQHQISAAESQGHLLL